MFVLIGSYGRRISKVSHARIRSYVTLAQPSTSDAASPTGYTDSLFQLIEEMRSSPATLSKWMWSQRPASSVSRRQSNSLAFGTCTALVPVCGSPSRAWSSEPAGMLQSHRNLTKHVRTNYVAAPCKIKEASPSGVIAIDIDITNGRNSSVLLQQVGAVDLSWNDDIILHHYKEIFDYHTVKAHYHIHTPDWTSLESRVSGYDNVMQCTPVKLADGKLEYSKETTPQKMPKNPSGLPSEEQLNLIMNNLTENFPKLFVKSHDYRIYRQDLIFENNFGKKSTTTVGLTAYILQVAKLRVYTHVRYANAKIIILKTTSSTADGTVRIRWRLSGIPQMRAFMFWKFLPWMYKNSLTEQSEWLDGFSTFYVGGSDGLVLKHRLDKVIPDEDFDVKKDKNLAKLGLVS